MKHPTLFDVPKDSPSRKDRINEFKAKHGIETWNSHTEGWPWVACLISEIKKEGSCYRCYGVKVEDDMPTVFSKVCRLIEEAVKNLLAHRNNQSKPQRLTPARFTVRE